VIILAAFKNLKELEKFLNNKIKSAMANEVAEKVRDVQQSKIDTEVYDAYQPNTPDNEPYVYDRRKDNDGLRDRENMIADVKDSGHGVELSVENVAKGKDKDFQLAGLIEYGDNAGYGEYDYKYNREGTAEQYLKERPFIEETRKSLRQTKQHVDALKQGLHRQGINSK
jgi:hypothetical protein